MMADDSDIPPPPDAMNLVHKACAEGTVGAMRRLRAKMARLDPAAPAVMRRRPPAAKVNNTDSLHIKH